MSTNREPIGVIGTGYVGLVTAAGFAELGNEVYCIDIDAAKIEGLKQGRMPIWEPGLEELVARHRDRLHFSTDIADALEHARLLFVAVGTPPTYSGDADLSAVHAVVNAMPPSDEHALVMKSTVPVGTGETIQRIFAEQGKALPLRVVPRVPQGGLGDQGLPGARPRRRRRRGRLGRRCRRRALRAARRPARADGHQERRDGQARVQRVPGDEDLVHQRDRQRVRGDRRRRRRGRARAWASTTASGRSSCRPGIGFGGSCFPKDVTALKQLAGNSGYHFQLLNSVIEVNELQKRRVIAKLEKHLGRLVDKEIALLGLAFKPNTDDMREASSLVLSSRLQAAGAHVRAYDPVAEEEARKLIRGVDFKSSALEAIEGADAVVLVTEWPEFAELDLTDVAAAMRGQPARRRAQPVRPGRVRDAGLIYEGIGRAAARRIRRSEARCRR